MLSTIIYILLGAVLTVALIVLIVIGVLLVTYRLFGAKKLNLPGPYHYPFFGSFFEFFQNQNNIYDWLYGLAKEFKQTFHFSIPLTNPYIVVMDPESVKYILNDNMMNYHREPVYKVFSELLGEGIFNVDGKKWKEQRQIASHMFSMKKLKNKAFDTFVECSDILVEKIKVYAKNDEVFDLQELMYRTTMDSICKIAFDYDVGCLKADKMPDFANAIDNATRYLFYRLNDPLLFPKKILNANDEKTYHDNIKLLNELCMNIIKERKNQLNNPDYHADDMLSLFMKDGYLDDTFLRDIVFSFIIAGRDTTASGTSWMLYEIIEHPNIYYDIKTNLSWINTDNLEFNDLSKMKTIHHTFMETIRLHPPVPFLFKCAKNKDKLPDGTKVNVNDHVVYSPYIFGRLESIWGDDADMFNPSRWVDEELPIKTVSPYKYLTFNAGPRLCLGKAFAIMEAKVIIAKLMKNFKFERVNNEKLTYSIGITSSIKGPLLVRAKIST